MPRNRSPPPWKTLALWNLAHGRQWLRELAHRQPPKRRLRARNRLRINQLDGLLKIVLWASTCFMAEGDYAGVHDALKAEQAIVCIGTRERVSETALKILSILEEAGTLESAPKTGLLLYRVRSEVRGMSEAGLLEQREEVLATAEKGRALAAESRAA